LEASTLRRLWQVGRPWRLGRPWWLWQVGRPRRELLFLEVAVGVVLLLLLLLLPLEQVLEMLHSFRKLGLFGLHAVLLWRLLRLQQLLNGELSNTRLLLKGLLGLLLLLLKLVKDRQACWLTIALSCRLRGFPGFVTAVLLVTYG